ncbi:helix-turn-helix transcriptional regulator [uncultured Tateyamaria sp.]|uniref:helix-turn-helix domain-containing protein n=1 Tax=uncultured Tateyamaria sp. TaxID=455651 RepID=UPI002620A234|nr:helix-turn-helix transcriptional regulator [uncultured Tateyamaria sp.]
MDAATQILLQLAGIHSLRDEVRAALNGKGTKPKPQTLAQLLPAQRIRKGWELKRICERSNLSRSQVSGLEDGTHTEPGLRTIQALAYGYALPFHLVLLAAMQTQGSAPGAQPVSPEEMVKRRGDRNPDPQVWGRAHRCE